MRKLPRYPDCFICGRDNTAGTNVTFTATKEGVETTYMADKKHQGYKGILHGGVISALLDECLGWAISIKQKQMYVTGELTVRYEKPIPIDVVMTIKGYMSEEQDTSKSYIYSHGHIIDGKGTVYARAHGRYFPLPDQLVDSVLDYLELDDYPNKAVKREHLWD